MKPAVGWALRGIVVMTFCLVFPAFSIAQAEDVLTWERCLELAAQHNPQLLAAQTRFQEADGRIMEFRARFAPKIQAQAITLPTQVEVSATQVLYSHGLGAGLRQVLLGRPAARTNLELTAIELVYALRQTWANALAAQIRVNLRRDFAANLKKMSDSAPRLFDAGKLTKSSLTQLDVRYSLAQNQINEAEEAAIEARIRLDQIIGVTPDPNPPLQGSLDTKVPADLDQVQLTALALRSRRDLTLLENLEASAHEEIRIAGAPGYPTASLFGIAHYEPFEQRFLNKVRGADDSRSSLEGGIRVGWRVFDAGETLGRVRTARAASETRKILTEELRRNIPGEVAAALSTLKSSQASLEAINRGTAGEKSLALVREDFTNGRATQTDILETENANLAQREARLVAELRVALSRADLDRATGQGVQLLGTK